MPRIIPRSASFRCALAGAVMLCLWMAGLMAVSPELHEHLHHDAGHADHTCLVSIMIGGGCDAVMLVALPEVMSMEWLGTVPQMRAQWVRPLFLDCGVLEHGPPVRA